MRYGVFGVMLVLAAAVLMFAPGAAGAQEGVATDVAESEEVRGVIFLVRHAETQSDGTEDPGLSREGRQRAARLAVALADAGLDWIYTTDYARTRGTAGVVAERVRLPVRIYDPMRLETFARAITDRGGRVLVVGHSNTTPELVEALGGEPGPPVHEAEHDRLYILILDGDAVRTVLLRY